MTDKVWFPIDIREWLIKRNERIAKYIQKEAQDWVKEHPIAQGEFRKSLDTDKILKSEPHD